MKVAICDDEKNIAELFGAKVRAEDEKIELSVFTSGADLIKSDKLFDIVFLDIEMEPMDGFQVADILNKQHPKCIVSFITTHAELAVDGYDYQPFRYILKTAPEPVIKRKIKETLHEYYCRNKTLSIAYKGNYSSLLVNEILYIEIKGHCMRIVLEKAELLWNKQLNEVEKMLEEYGLIRCHRSYMAALQHIKAVSPLKIDMKNGEQIPIGRKYKNHFMEEYNHFILVG